MDLHLRVEIRNKYTNVHLYQQTPSKGTQLLFSKVFFVGLVFFVWFGLLICFTQELPLGVAEARN